MHAGLARKAVVTDYVSHDVLGLAGPADKSVCSALRPLRAMPSVEFFPNE